jgi:hypothetical protein
MATFRMAALVVGALLLSGCAGLKWSLGYNPNTRQWVVSGEMPTTKSLAK